MSKIDYTAAGRRLQDQHDNGPQALVRQQLEHHNEYLQAKVPQLERWITGGVDPRALVRFAMLDLGADTKAAAKLRECSRESIFMSLLACAVTGLEPGALKGEAFLVPFAKKAQFMVGWRGIVKQALRTREIVGMRSNVVFEHDVFELDLGSGAPPVHRPLLRGDRGPIIGAWAAAYFKAGHAEIEWMDRADLDAVKEVAVKRGASDAWTVWEDQMFRKAPLRRLGKRLPLGHDYYVSEAVEEAQASGRSGRDVLDIVTDGEASRTEAHADIAASMRAQVTPVGEISQDEAAEIAKREWDERD